MKNKISSIIAMVFVMGIYMVYSITFSTSQDPITIEELKMYYYVKYLIFPAGIAAISIGLVFYGFYLNKKEDIRI
jgi:cytochrome c biogenesis protein CcdA